MIVPMCISLYYSFCDYNILTPPVFTGLKNFKRMIEDSVFYQTLFVTFKFAIISVPLRLVFALIVAMLLFKSTKMTGIYRAMYYLPSIIGGSVAVAILWKRLFSLDGLINKILMSLGMKESVAWLGHADGNLDADHPGGMAVRFLHADLSFRPETDSHQSL